MMESPARKCSIHIGEGQQGSHYTEEELAFLSAVQSYMKKHKRRFPTFVELLNVARSMGYRKDVPQISSQETAPAQADPN